MTDRSAAACPCVACAVVRSDSVQAVLDAGSGDVRAALKAAMLGRLQQMSRSKFGSNVVERCLRQSSPAWRAAFIRELCSAPLVAELLKDRYANYVLQTGLAVCPQTELAGMVQAIAPHMAALRENVRSKWRQLIKRANADMEVAATTAALSATGAAASAAGTAATKEPGASTAPQQQQQQAQSRGLVGRSPSPPPFVASSLPKAGI